MGVLLIIFGITAGFFGAKLLPQVASVFAFCFTFPLMITVCSLLGGFEAFEEQEEYEEDTNAIFAIICTVLSILMSFYVSHVVRRHQRIGPFLLGVTVGVTLGLIINSLVFEEIMGVEIAIVKILVVSVLALFVSIGTAKWCKTLVAPMTSFIGSYSIVRGLSMFLGGFPKSWGSFTDVNDMVLIYFFLIILMTLIGTVYQVFKKFHHGYKNHSGVIII